MVACKECRRYALGGWCYWGNTVEMVGFDPVNGRKARAKDKGFPVWFLNHDGDCKHFQAREDVEAKEVDQNGKWG